MPGDVSDASGVERPLNGLLRESATGWREARRASVAAARYLDKIKTVREESDQMIDAFRYVADGEPETDSSETLLSVARAAAGLSVAASRMNRPFLPRRVLSVFLCGFARSARDVVAMAEELRMARKSQSHSLGLWTRQALLRAATELGGPNGLSDLLLALERISLTVTSRDLVAAALWPPRDAREIPFIEYREGMRFSEKGWGRALEEPVSLALLARAFGDPSVRVALHTVRTREAVSDQLLMGLRARDAGAIDDGQLWGFYVRCEKAEAEAEAAWGCGTETARCDAEVREWLVQSGSRRISNAMREAVVALAIEGTQGG